MGLARGERGLARAVTWTWQRVHRLRPSLVGGCRPLEILPLLPERHWEVRHHAQVAPWGIASEILVAGRAA